MKLCDLCGVKPRTNRSRCDDCLGVNRVHHVIGASVHPSTRYSDDPDAQRFVEEHPDGATLEEVAQAFGVTRERIRQIEEKALRRVAFRMRLAGVSMAELAEHFGIDVDKRRGAA